MLALIAAPLAYAQTDDSDVHVDTVATVQDVIDYFTITESQLGEDDDMTTDIIQVGSANNVYTSNIGYTWSAARFKYRALDNKYNDVYFNGVQVNGAENGRFQFSNIGGINDAVRQKDAASPFEDNTYSMSGLGGSTNYDFRAASMPVGHKVTLSGCNRNYTLRAMYSYGTGLSKSGWAFYGTVGYRWANMNTAAVKGTFYNSLSYFLSIEKKWGDRHSLSLSTWGNPTERAQQGASTDEAYWLANDRQYNPYWGYQNGEKRASRVVNDFAPSAVLTWDWKINDDMKLTTSVFGKYGKYSATRLNYNDSKNPAPDYWKAFPSSYYDVWDIENVETGYTGNIQNWSYAVQQWNDAVNYWTSSEANRQINFDRLYEANQTNNLAGKDAAYYISAKHNDNIQLRLSTAWSWNIDKNTKWHVGLQLGGNKGMHYQTMEDMLGANSMHNINNYAIGTYLPGSAQTQYDLNNPNGVVNKGDKMAYDYDLWVRDIRLWTSFVKDYGISHNYITGKIGLKQMWRNGHMRNGICADNSYGESDKSGFLDGGAKIGTVLNLGKGNAITFGVGYEAKAPEASNAFVSPEMNNDFVKNLRNEKVISADLGYAINNNWLRLNLNGYYYHTYNGTEWQNFYFDDVNSFTYVSLNNIQKQYYGVELGAKINITSSLNITLLGNYSESEYTENSDVNYMLSTSGNAISDICFNKGMHESGTPLAAVSLGINYKIKGWYLNLTGNYYDRIYLSYSPCLRYKANVTTTYEDPVSGETKETYNVPGQAKGNGGFMLDASIGKQFKIAHHPLSVNLQLCNITNNTGITTGGYEQSRSNYSTNKSGTAGNERIYNFTMNPKKFYAQGFNFMLNVNYRF